MTKNAVEYEHLMDTSFSDANNTVRTSVMPRWERKKQKMLQEQKKQQQQQQSQTQDASNTSKDGSSGSGSSGPQGDRFIPSRAGMNMEISKHLMLSCSINSSGDQMQENMLPEEQRAIADSQKDAYSSSLSSALLGVDDLQDNRVMAYTEKAPVPVGDTVNNLNVLYSATSAAGKKKSNTKLVTRTIPTAPSRVLDAPDLMDDYYLNLLSWSDTNILAVALAQTVYLWNAGTGQIEELCTFDEGPNAHISSVQWVQEGGAHLAVGVSSGMTQLWDVQQGKQLRGMDGHTDRVGALSWNRHILSSGSRDTTIINHDVRVARHNVASLQGHTQEVCGLTWSPDGETLASGGNDNLLCLWNASASGVQSTPRYRFTDHQAAVKALAWSPHERNLLATGAGTADRTIKFWNTSTGALLNSIDTGSQVCALKWSPFEKEILSSHGYARNQLCLWKYPSMAKIKEFERHTSRVLHLAVSPDGGTVLSAAADETLCFWDIFAPPSAAAKGGKGAAAVGAKDPFRQGAAPKTTRITQIR
mmetsp:Transcript_8389/g.17448  ORF Transcript_8389/g.17448 Transcript_8389/m.17448 type:complete len:531 (-) Transcript_8389:1279-2871(-)|eukprot:CAMPEP_0172470100 /NCGR_PEP_ID=MMETSP1065-20121228/65487_1 /TAXON_ID=265537 /ORGANISM="Amphiprora paludosa, Strain CCMP125" /LENGTH=530 /DNA_ID=CAMNT_0013227945 /DNA_START=29 /DNA_END=1621 /DNA_ORIENTATION=-